ncbi:uncharacterized protein EAE97_008083 [Botrytis byssoidea]|uniref:Ig-like domain-containing protein n=1 Tax=Botrytis byssoidea TaxID=139641 RepID=A0A9P5LU55_9HELO|nr:uncharacterized protein EAE97_008083 [Botrytis byssoidea]KAF7935176.1 hypothetical protein EAE97_008083 [Botrytis byssoidea]
MMSLRLVSSLWVVISFLKFGQAAVLYSNSTTSATPASTVSGSIPSTITPSATLSYADVQSTTQFFPITPGPYWGNQSIPINTCTEWNLNGITPQLIWTPCHIFAGTVQLSYFPQASGNISYPSTYYNEAIGITMTSPSMYMVINTISGYNSCGQVGPTMSNVIISLHPSNVSTIARYTASDQQVNTTPAALLTLSDIISGCSTITLTEASTNGAIQSMHAMDNDYNRCFPALAIPTPQIESSGLPFFRHCGQDNARLGLFDPPGAVPPVNALLPVTSATPATSTSIPASTAQSPSSSQPSKTSIVNSPSSTSTSDVQVPKSSPVPSDTSIPALEASSSNALSTTVLAVQDPTTTDDSPQPVSSVPVIPANTPIPIATIASSVISVIPSDSIIVVGGQTASLDGAPITISSSIVQLTPSGLVIANENGESSQSSVYTIPTTRAVATAASPSKIATLAGGEIISAIPGASTLIVAGQTITSGAPAITLSGSNSVVSLGSQGLVVQESNGVVSTYSIPTAAPIPAVVSSAIATLAGGEIVSAGADASNVVLGSQSLVLDGPAITLSNSAVATLGAAGLIVQYAGGIVSTIPLSAATSLPIHLATPETSITEIRTSEIVIYSSGKPVSTYYSTLTDTTSVTEIRTSEIIVHSSGEPVSTFYSTYTSSKKLATSGSTTTSPASKPDILVIETGNGGASSTSTKSSDTFAITNIVFNGGVDSSKGGLINGLSLVGLLGVWGMMNAF